MKIAIIAMCTNAQPSVRNMEAFEDTVVRYYNENKDKFSHHYDFFEYMADENETDGTLKIKDNGVNVLTISDVESVYRTFEKTYKAFELINKYADYDLYVRINISLWLNMHLLDAVAGSFDKECIYCNAINSHVNVTSPYVNDIYPRGDMFIFGKPTMDGFLEHGKKYMYCDQDMRSRNGVEHVDDCLLGVCLIDIYGKDYYKHIIPLRYMYIPGKTIHIGNIIDNYSIGFRVKTVPEGMNSGYSWDDNEYRKKDGDKMRELQEYFEKNEVDYTGVTVKDIVTDDTNERPTLFVSASNQSIRNVFYRFLASKRK